MTFKIKTSFVVIAWAISPFANSADHLVLDEVVVTAPTMEQPLVVKTNPRKPRQPIPAHDGADYLKTIPGFSVIRKGGTDGDPVLRGMAGSRLNILIDGQSVLGGCNQRMDAPTAYIFPEVFDSLTVIKGPSVLYGAGNSAGTVLFERNRSNFTEAKYKAHGSLTIGSFGRHDEVVEGKTGNASAFAQVTATNSQSEDYTDGSGQAVHSAYRRYSTHATLGWTPTEDTLLELSGAQSDGHAAYADRGMDGSKFLRQNVGLKLQQKHISPLFEKVEVLASSNDVDHVMDDQTLRTPRMMGYANLKRITTDARIAAVLRLSDPTKLTLGTDAQSNSHASRSAGTNGVYGTFANDAAFKQQGFFGELHRILDAEQRIVAGYRADIWNVQDQRGAMIMNSNTMGMSINPSSGKSRNETLHSGFVRYETQFSAPTTSYIGLGHTTRFPDYWELIAKQNVTSASAFDTAAEKTDQLDAGLLYKTEGTDVTISMFYSKVTDFILIDYSAMNKMSTGAVRNVNATTLGTELGYAQVFGEGWKLNTSLAYVRGDNTTDGTPLAQLPPLEGRVGLAYDDKVWSYGALLRLVAAQDRYDLNKGNIAGKDLGASSGFSIFSLNAGWRPNKKTLVSAGVDNLFNITYAEFISRAASNGMGGALPGYATTTRVNEPGRTLWMKASFSM